jgi:hypothetical protein
MDKCEIELIICCWMLIIGAFIIDRIAKISPQHAARSLYRQLFIIHEGR